MRHELKLLVLGIVLATGVSSAAQQTLTPRDLRVYVGTGGTNGSVIQGTALNANGTPVPRARVQLRNLATNRIEQVSATNLAGEFTFFVQPNVPYLVELADTFGRVVAVGNLLTMQAGEVAAAVVTLPGLPAVAGLFGDTVASVMSAAAGVGITAIEDVLPPDSPRQ